jgi:predicted transcriptional regulator
MDDKTLELTLAQVSNDLDAIKRLLILSLMRNGTSQAGIAEALGVNQATVSRLFPKGLNKALDK